MIDKVLTFLRDEVNNYLDLRTGLDKKLTLSNIVEQNGEINNETPVILTLVNVEEEKVNKAPVSYKESGNGELSRSNPEIKLNLYILFTANFGKNNYEESLKFLSAVIRCFQGKNVFDHQNAPGLNENIEKLIAELVTLSFEQQNHLWGTIGAKYMPSVMYKIRMLTIQEDQVLEKIKSVRTIDSNLLKN